MSTNLNAEFWTKRYLDQQTGWDLGTVSPPLKAYIDQLTDRDLRILIPGCGNAHEGAYLWKEGFKNTHLLDFAEPALKAFNKNYPDFPKEQLHAGDFFKHTGEYDLILEQTMFCAIDPSKRNQYAEKCSSLLRKSGKVIGLLFDCVFEAGPPFGGNKSDYEKIFQHYFNKTDISPCYNSVKPRLGSEVFIKLIK